MSYSGNFVTRTPSMPATTRALGPFDLGISYKRNCYSFGNSEAPSVICLIGSCRITPVLNFIRAYNSLHGDPFEILCFNPVECWEGPGHEMADGVNKQLENYRFGKVDFLVCEHMENCGCLNTVVEAGQNIFTTLGCSPGKTIRLPNWHCLFIFDKEISDVNPVYAALPAADRAVLLRKQTLEHKERYLGYCRASSIPELEAWVVENWDTVRMGWTNSHATLALQWKIFQLVAPMIGLEITRELAAHPLCVVDAFDNCHATTLGPVDYEANNWKF